MGVRLRQLRLLLWKNWVIKIRKPWMLLVELLLPCLLVGVLVYLRMAIKQNWVGESVFSPTHGSLDGIESDLETVLSMQRLVDEGRAPFTKFVGVAPMTNPAAAIYAKQMNETLRNWGITLPVLRPYDSEEEAVAAASENSHDVVGVIVFDETPDQSTVRYKLRAPAFLVEKTEWWWRFAHGQMPNPRRSSYVTNGFCYLQAFVNDAIVRVVTGTNLTTPLPLAIELNQFPYPAHYQEIFGLLLSGTLHLFMVFSWIASCSFLVTAIVREKELRLKELMSIMALKKSVYWVSWFITGMAPLIFSSCLVVFLFKVGNVLPYTGVGILLAYLVCFSMATVSLSFLLSTLSSNANIAGSCSGLVYFLFYMPFIYASLNYEDLSTTSKGGLALFSTTAFALGLKSLAERELVGVGVQWSTMFQNSNDGTSFTFGMAMAMLLVDTFLYLTLATYIEAVWPGRYGTGKPVLFPLLWVRDQITRLVRRQKKWLPQISSHDAFFQPMARHSLELDDALDCCALNPNVEKAAIEGRAGVELRKLSKTYENGKVALNNLSLKMYEGQITALLGHNGAGKTTAMSILTGLYPPTSGTALVNGHSIVGDKEAARRSIGVCPQQNVLFDGLTVEEHLQFAIQLKNGTCRELADKEVDRLLEELSLSDKKHVDAASLSGGYKRKLCVGMALAGQSKVIVLDEPTAGMDPCARRATWELLLRARHDRTMLMSTHHLDEADVLGDRIAILSAGELKACGSSLFLKCRYGQGYYLALAKSPQYDAIAVQNALSSIIPGVSTGPVHTSTARFVLPRETVSLFPALLEALENGAADWGVESYGISATTLEDVFLEITAPRGKNEEWSLTDDVTPQPIDFESRRASDTSSTVLHDIDDTESALLHNQSDLRESDMALFRRRFLALLKKRYHWAKRDIKGMISQLVLPAVFVCVAMYVAHTFPTVDDQPPLALTTDYFPQPNIIPYAFNADWQGGMPEGETLSTVAHVIGPGDVLQRVDGGNLTSYLLETRLTHWYDQFGALSTSVGQGDNRTVMTSWWNGHAFHSPPTYLAMAWNTLLRLAGQGKGGPIEIETTTHPLPYTVEERLSRMRLRGADFMETTCITIALAFIPASFATFVVHEVSSKSRHLQRISGVGPLLYWLATGLFDTCSYLLSVCLILGILQVANVSALSGANLLPVLAMLLLYGAATIPATYLLSRLFTVPANAYVGLIIANLVTGVFSSAVCFALDRVEEQADLRHLNQWLIRIFMVFPSFCLGRGLMKLSKAQLSHDIRLKLGLEMARLNPFAWDVLGKFALALGLFAPIMCFALFLTESSFIDSLLQLANHHIPSNSKKRRQQILESQLDDEDCDVADERIRVETGRALQCGDALVVSDLYKIYDGQSSPAVKSLTFSVPAGQCFGLLGANGAGKTTTFGVLTTDMRPDSGCAYVGGWSVVTHKDEARKEMGYCPQFDALLDLLTAKETLAMYATLRGVPEHSIPRLVESLLTSLDLEQFADKITRDYSGGTKRKLSAAVALIGQPKVVFLDEPTAGMDPKARRHLWHVIQSVSQSGQAVVLTSHSLEECELLCERLAIMTHGTMRCIGSPQHLKNRHCHGYSITAKLADPVEAVSLVDVIGHRLPQSRLVECHRGSIKFIVTSDAHDDGQSVKASALFGLLEELRKTYTIDDYMISQTTLEEVFLRLASETAETKI